jgi:predicted secreted protein
MNWFTGTVLYILIWWLTLFVVLPIGTQPEANADSDTGWRGAPKRPRILMKVIVTTIVALILWVIIWLVIDSDLLSFRHGILAGTPDSN